MKRIIIAGFIATITFTANAERTLFNELFGKTKVPRIDFRAEIDLSQGFSGVCKKSNDQVVGISTENSLDVKSGLKFDTFERTEPRHEITFFFNHRAFYGEATYFSNNYRLQNIMVGHDKFFFAITNGSETHFLTLYNNGIAYLNSNSGYVNMAENTRITNSELILMRCIIEEPEPYNPH